VARQRLSGLLGTPVLDVSDNLGVEAHNLVGRQIKRTGRWPGFRSPHVIACRMADKAASRSDLWGTCLKTCVLIRSNPPEVMANTGES
jgi:hypothetical protein